MKTMMNGNRVENSNHGNVDLKRSSWNNTRGNFEVFEKMEIQMNNI